MRYDMHDGSKPSDLAFYTDPLRSMFEMMALPCVHAGAEDVTERG